MGEFSKTSDQKSFQSIIKRNYILALSLIGLVSSARYLGLYLVIKIQSANAAIVNISGRQRMLSQRAAFEAHRLALEDDEASRGRLRSDLLAIADEMEKSHTRLLLGDPERDLPGGPSAAVRAIYFEAPVFLERKMREFIAEARTLARAPDGELTSGNPHLQNILSLSDSELIDALEALVGQYQEESDAKVLRLRTMGMGALGLILFVLLLEDIFIFRPLSRRVENKARQLVESERKLRDIASALGEGVFVTDRAGRLVFMNPEAERVTGWREDEMMGKNVHETLHFQTADGKSNPFENCAIAKTLRTGETLRVEEDVYTRRDGTIFPVSLVCAPITSGGGASGAVVAFHDVSERKRAEAELRRRAELIQLQQEITVAANESSTVDEAILTCLGKIRAFTGWELGHAYLAAPDGLLIPSELWSVADKNRYDKFLKATSSTTFLPGKGLPGRVYETGQPAWITDIGEDTNFPRARTAHSVGLISGFAFPVTERAKVTAVLEFFCARRAEPDRPLLDCIAALATQIGRATERKRAGEELREAKERAEKATELKDKFVSLVAHDLRSPLATVIGFLEAISLDEANPVSEKHKKDIGAAKRNLEGLINVIDRLLNITRLKTGKIKLHSRFIDGRKTAAKVVKNLERAAENKGIAIINNVPEGLRLYADPDLFHEVIQNLLTNAIKFCRSGDTVTVFTPPDKRTCVSVKDNGPGVAPDILPDIFRHDVKTTTRGTAGEKGTGLGLPFCHDIMQAHGGCLTVESSEGKGSVFHAELPYVRPLVLVVDDDDVLRGVYTAMLEEMDMEVIGAEDGKKAISILKERTPHLIILDIYMPVMDGFGLLEHISSSPELKSIPVVVVTIDREVETSEKAFQMGVNDVVNKPLSPNVFIPKVRRLLEDAPRLV